HRLRRLEARVARAPPGAPHVGIARPAFARGRKIELQEIAREHGIVVLVVVLHGSRSEHVERARREKPRAERRRLGAAQRDELTLAAPSAPRAQNQHEPRHEPARRAPVNHRSTPGLAGEAPTMRASRSACGLSGCRRRKSRARAAARSGAPEAPSASMRSTLASCRKVPRGNRAPYASSSCNARARRCGAERRARAVQGTDLLAQGALRVSLG